MARKPAQVQVHVRLRAFRDNRATCVQPILSICDLRALA
jgi:hypothetical protein